MCRPAVPPTLALVPHRLARRVYLMDAALALLLLVLSYPQVKKPPITAEVVNSLAAYWAFSSLCVAGLLLRHRWALPALGLAVAGAAGHVFVREWHLDVAVIFPVFIDLAVPLTLYTVVSRGPSRRLSAAILAALVAGEIAHGLFSPATLNDVGGDPDNAGAQFTALQHEVIEPRLMELLALALAYALGEGARSRQAHLRTLQQHAADAEREQQQRIALATAKERARIGRDLHDVIAHSLAVIVAQAQAAIATRQRHPQRAAHAMREVVTVGRESLSEMRRLVGAFGPGSERELAPPVGVDALPALIERTRAAGLPVRLTVDGSPANLPAGIEVCVYRIVQEALTNTLKHAGAGAEATVRLALHAEHVEVEVTDNGSGPPFEPHAAGGNGLRGIAERVNLLSGGLWTGPGPDGGFGIRVRLPLAAAGAAP
jgi:signal transduction histidine kinase